MKVSGSDFDRHLGDIFASWKIWEFDFVKHSSTQLLKESAGLKRISLASSLGSY